MIPFKFQMVLVLAVGDLSMLRFESSSRKLFLNGNVIRISRIIIHFFNDMACSKVSTYF